MISVSMERGDPTLYHGPKQSYFGPVNFKFIRGVVTTPLVNHVTKKGLVGRGLISIRVLSIKTQNMIPSDPTPNLVPTLLMDS